jgi:hypothetical protein
MFTVAEWLIGWDLDNCEKLESCPNHAPNAREVSCNVGEIKVE